MGEEVDFTLRAWGKGFEVHLFPEIIVLHRRSPITRSNKRIAFYRARNIVFYNILNKPIFIGIFRAIIALFILLARNLGNLKSLIYTTLGSLCGFIGVIRYFGYRTPMSFIRYLEYDRLPGSSLIFSGKTPP
jgi:GT2 family glycosyltransferase